MNGIAFGRDGSGNVALVVNNSLGKGTAVLVTHPLEYYLSLMPDAHLSNKTFRVYEALKKVTRLAAEPFTCDDPFLEVGWMETETKNDAILIMINHERVNINPTISLRESWHVRSLIDGDADLNEAGKRLKLSFAPSEIKILTLRR